MHEDLPNEQHTALSRRAMLVKGGWLAAGLMFPTAHLSAAVTHLPKPDAHIRAAFMALSRRLTERQDLDIDLGMALLQGLLAFTPVTPTSLVELQKMSCTMSEATAQMLADVARKTSDSMATTLDAMMTAWYRGVAGDQVVVYASAMMFNTVRDVLSPKTYARGAPFNWTITPPPVPVPFTAHATLLTPLFDGELPHDQDGCE